MITLAKAVKKAPQTREEILEEALGDIRSKFGDGAIMRLGDTAKKNVDVISSGVLPLDVALGIGGYPKGRIVEIFGPEGSGKTTIALCAVAEAHCRNAGGAGEIQEPGGMGHPQAGQQGMQTYIESPRIHHRKYCSRCRVQLAAHLLSQVPE